MTTIPRLAESHTAPALQTRKAVAVHSGARDAYQLALALAEDGLLEILVTDLFWPADHPRAAALASHLPATLQAMLRQRSEPRLSAERVRSVPFTGLATLLVDKIVAKLPKAPAALRRRMMRHADSVLGRTAGKLARRTQSALIAYSYYAYDAFHASKKPGILFQLHPHPASMRRILNEELTAHPDCASSLRQEWELSLPEADFQHLVLEPTLAAKILVASSFTKSTLVANGIPDERVDVIPYGVDTTRFHPAPALRAAPGSPLRLLFVGRINQRKGIKYLLEALRLLNDSDIHLTVCGRVVDGLELFKPFANRITIRPDVSAAELVRAYQAADLFVFPSVAEGFGQVLLEALASGLPILSTTRTAAPDLIDEGVQGWVVEPRRPDLLAERIAWAATHRVELAAMGQAARRRAEQFTWQRFRDGIVASVSIFLDKQNAAFVGKQNAARHGLQSREASRV